MHIFFLKTSALSVFHHHIISISQNKIIVSIQTGGYNLTNTSRYWTYLTSVICGAAEELDDEIPEHDYFLKYGPGYELSINKRNVKDSNTENDMAEVYEIIKGMRTA